MRIAAICQKFAIFASGTSDFNDNVEAPSDIRGNCPLISHYGSPRSCSAAPPADGNGGRNLHDIKAPEMRRIFRKMRKNGITWTHGKNYYS